MAYSTEVIRRARQQLASAKADWESKQQHNLQEAYNRLPRLLEIDRQLRLTMVQVAQAAFAQGGDVQEMMAKVKAENLRLQEERKALIAANFPSDFLDEGPFCPHCDGSGYVGSQMCSCLKELCKVEQCKELTYLCAGNERFEDFHLEYYPEKDNVRLVMARTYDICRNYAENFDETSGNLLFSGDTGLGKTFLSACIARTVAENGHSVIYETAGHLFARMERAKFDGDEESRREVDKYSACDLLIIDDLGTEMPGQFTTAALYTLINDRILTGKATIISTNLNSEDLAKRYNPQIASRLRGSFQRLAFLGEDIRLKKNWR